MSDYFGPDHDRQVGVNLFRRVRELFTQDPIASRLTHETFPGVDVQSDEDVIDAALTGGSCAPPP